MKKEIAERLKNGEIHEPLPGLYLSERNEVENLALHLARAKEAYDAWKELNPVRGLDELVNTVTDGLNDNGRTTSQLGAEPEPHGASLTPSRYLDINSAREAATLWVTWNEDAISPVNKDLWRFMEHCAVRNRVPLILARAIAKATFPVLRAVGARGIQYYCMLVSSAEKVDLASLQVETDLLGLPHVKDAHEMKDHAAISVLLAQVSSVGASRFPSVPVEAALSVALRRGFATKGPTPRALRRWAVDIEHESGIALPKLWQTSLRRWTQSEGEPTSRDTAVNVSTPAAAAVASRERAEQSTAPSDHDNRLLEPHRIRIAAEVDADTFASLGQKLKRRGA